MRFNPTNYPPGVSDRDFDDPQEGDFRARDSRVELIPPHTDHPPCGMPGCGKSQTGKWAAPVYLCEVRGISRTWGGLETATTTLAICDTCYQGLGHLATAAYMADEEKRK